MRRPNTLIETLWGSQSHVRTILLCVIRLAPPGSRAGIALTMKVQGQKDHIKDVSFHYSYISSEYKQIWQASLTHEQRQSTNCILPEVQLQDDVAAALARSSTGWKIVREQLKDVFFSTFDMLIHNPKSHEALEAQKLAESFNKLKTEIYSLAGGEALGDGWEWGHREAASSNLPTLT